MNHFEHFQLEVSFTPDQEAVRKAYLRISKENHPDFQMGDDAAYEQALLNTASNNEAYKVMSNRDQLIPYVLNLLGNGVQEGDKLSPEFLMDMMEWNERIMDVQMEGDPTAAAQLVIDVEGLEKQFESKLDAAIEQYEASNDEALLSQIKEIYLQRKYLLRIRESINKFAAR